MADKRNFWMLFAIFVMGLVLGGLKTPKVMTTWLVLALLINLTMCCCLLGLAGTIFGK